MKAVRCNPYKFLLKHYPIRSQAHGEKKIFLERKSRWHPDERRKGWHSQYDEIREGYNFLRQPDKLILFDTDFYKKYLVERLSGIGIVEREISTKKSYISLKELLKKLFRLYRKIHSK